MRMHVISILAVTVLAAGTVACAADQAQGSAEKDAKAVSALRKKYATVRGDQKRTAGEALVRGLLQHSRSAAAEKDFAGAIASCRQAIAISGALKSASRSVAEARMKEIFVERKEQQEIDKMIADLKANPKDTATRTKLIRMHLIENDDPATAASFLSDDCGKDLRTHIPLAVKEVGKLSEADALRLGRWYKSLADKADGEAALAMYRRADASYKAYLAAHKAEDDSRKKVLLEAEQVQAKLMLAAIAAAREKDVTVRPVDLKLPKKAGMIKMYCSENGRLSKLAVSPCGRTIAVVGGDAKIGIQLWDVAKAKKLWTSAEAGFQHAKLRFTPDGRKLLAVKAGGSVVEYLHISPKDGKVTAQRKMEKGHGYISYDGRICYHISPGDWTFTAMEFESGIVLRKTVVRLGGDFPFKGGLAVSPDGKYAWFCVGDMKLVNTETGKVIVSERPPKGKNWGNGFFANAGARAGATAYGTHGSNGETHVYDIASRKRAEKWDTGSTCILSPNQRWLVGPTGWLRPHGVYVRDRRTGKELADVKCPDGETHTCCWSADGKYVFLGGDGKFYLMGLGK